MAKLINHTSAPIPLPSQHVIPKHGEIEGLSNETIRGDNWPTLSGLILSGQVSVEFDADHGLETVASVASVSKRKSAVQSAE